MLSVRHTNQTRKNVADTTFKDQAHKDIQEMINNDMIKEHPTKEPLPWVSNAVIAPKSDGSIRIMLDARNMNKAIIGTQTILYRDTKTLRQNWQVAKFL